MKLVRFLVGSVFPRLVWVACLIFIAPSSALLAGDMTAAQIKQTQVNGIDLTYQDQGQGTPVVFVPGALSDYRVWDAEREAVASRYRFIALTQRSTEQVRGRIMERNSLLPLTPMISLPLSKD